MNIKPDMETFTEILNYIAVIQLLHIGHDFIIFFNIRYITKCSNGIFFQ